MDIVKHQGIHLQLMCCFPGAVQAVQGKVIQLRHWCALGFLGSAGPSDMNVRTMCCTEVERL